MKYECEVCGFLGEEEYKMEDNGVVLNVCNACYNGYLQRNGIKEEEKKKPKTEEEIAREAFEAFKKLKKKSKQFKTNKNISQYSEDKQLEQEYRDIEPEIKKSILERIGLEDFDIGDIRSELALSKLLGISQNEYEEVATDTVDEQQQALSQLVVATEQNQDAYDDKENEFETDDLDAGDTVVVKECTQLEIGQTQTTNEVQDEISQVATNSTKEQPNQSDEHKRDSVKCLANLQEFEINATVASQQVLEDGQSLSKMQSLEFGALFDMLKLQTDSINQLTEALKSAEKSVAKFGQIGEPSELTQLIGQRAQNTVESTAADSIDSGSAKEPSLVKDRAKSTMSMWAQIFLFMSKVYRYGIWTIVYVVLSVAVSTIFSLGDFDFSVVSGVLCAVSILFGVVFTVLIKSFYQRMSTNIGNNIKLKETVFAKVDCRLVANTEYTAINVLVNIAFAIAFLVPLFVCIGTITFGIVYSVVIGTNDFFPIFLGVSQVVAWILLMLSVLTAELFWSINERKFFQSLLIQDLYNKYK